MGTGKLDVLSMPCSMESHRTVPTEMVDSSRNAAVLFLHPKSVLDFSRVK